MEKKHSHHQFITLGGTPSKPKYTTRHLAALDFLLNIPMAKEAGIRQSGIMNAAKMLQVDEAEEIPNSKNEEESIDGNGTLQQNQNLLMSSEDYRNPLQDSAGKKLQGPATQYSYYPITIRYQIQRMGDQGALSRQWEDQILKPANQSTSILTSRVYFSKSQSYPTAVCSIIKYDATEEKARKEKLKAEDQKALKVFELPHRDWRGFSYKPLFKQLQEERVGEYFYEKGYLYDPDSLDDPELLYGSHRYALPRTATTGPVISSIILYVNKKELKESLNDQFHEKHPQLPVTLTLSKIRKLKKNMLFICLRNEIELSTVAITFINFERLCFKGVVTKVNRKLTMAVSFLLAYKFNESVSPKSKQMESMFEFFDTEWKIPKKEIFEAEFGAFIHLGFLMHIPNQHINYMYNRLLKMMNKSSWQYLGEDMQQVYIQDVYYLEKLKEFNRNKDKQTQEEKEYEKDQEKTSDKTYTNREIEDINNLPESEFSSTNTSAKVTKKFGLGHLNFFEKEKDKKSKIRGFSQLPTNESSNPENAQDPENDGTEEGKVNVLTPSASRTKSLLSSNQFLRLPKRFSSNSSTTLATASHKNTTDCPEEQASHLLEEPNN